MKRYPKYKESGIPWIGQIPEEWGTCQLWCVLEHITTGLNPRDNFKLTRDAENFYVTIANFKNGELFLDDKCDRINNEAWKIIQERSDLKKGDILFASISSEGHAYVLKEDPKNWNINESVFKLRFKNGLMNSQFAYYLLICNAFYKEMRSEATGATFQSIKQYQLKHNAIPIPPLAEQEAIAAFLDKKTGDIDELVGLLNKQIADVRAYRQSLITETVTQGLNKDVPMKDSGIEWIGQIPEGWKVMKLPYILDNLDYLRKPIASEKRSRNNPRYNYYGASGVIDKIDEYNVEDKVLLIGEDGANLVMRNLPLVYKAEGKFWVNNHAHILKPKANANYDYFYYFLELVDYTPYITGSAQPKLSQDNLNKVLCVLPSLSEQESIAHFLDAKTKDIDELLSKLEAQVADLLAYKSSLISEVVTGKIDIR